MKYQVRPIQVQDAIGVAKLIRKVMPEFGATGPGFAIHDTEVDAMFDVYSRPMHAYFVVVEGSLVVGGGGIGPLAGGRSDDCELRKMYFETDVRGLGLGHTLLDLCLKRAREMGFRRCYIETLQSMDRANSLYLRNGFEPMSGPMGETGHFACDAWYLKTI